MPNIKAIGKLNFLISNAKKTFNYLRLAFIKAPILQYFDLESSIKIEPNTSSYAMGKMLNQLNLNFDASPKDSNLKSDLGQWHLVAYFISKMIFVETHHKTHNPKLLSIIEAFKTWRH